MKKKAFFYLVTLLLVCLAVELMALGAFFLIGRGFSYSKMQNERKDILSENDGAAEVAQGMNPEKFRYKRHGGKVLLRAVLHPYYGSTTEGVDLRKKCPGQQACDQRIKTYEDESFLKTGGKILIVGILGGSFAHGTSSGSAPGLLEKELLKIPKYQDKDEVLVYHMAPGGFKQPQQLMKLNYFLALGAEFDLVINIDGFNEIVLPVEAISKGVHPIYPRNWYYLVQGGMTPELLSMYGRREYLKKRRVHWAGSFSHPLARFSVAANFIWASVDGRFSRNIHDADLSIVEYNEGESGRRPYEAAGPDYTFTTWDEYYRQMAEFWARSSMQMASICSGRGIEYHHFLQPNQYVEDSKPILEAERKIAVSPESGYGKRAKGGYPFLIRQGDLLRQQGVPFHDLTMMFADNPDRLYSDNCCHLNRRGYDLVVNEIAKRIREYHKRHDSRDSDSQENTKVKTTGE